MSVLRWREQNRATLAEVLPEAVVVVPIGATEQHGPYLPTGTDGFLAESVCERALEILDHRDDANDDAGSGSGTPYVLAPTIPVGASDHHLPFSGTLSLRPDTLHALLVDLARSIATCGGRRMVVVNGHGGNHGVAHAAGADASNRYDIVVATTDYWRLLPPEAGDGANVPGHAGEFEASLVLATRPELVADRPERVQVPEQPRVDGFDLHAAGAWQAIEGYSDDPARGAAARGQEWRERIAGVLADRLTELARVL